MSALSTIIQISPDELAAAIGAEIERRGLCAPMQALDIKEAAEYLGCDPKHLRRLVETGAVPAVNLSLGTGERAMWRFSKVALDRCLQGLKNV